MALTFRKGLFVLEPGPYNLLFGQDDMLVGCCCCCRLIGRYFFFDESQLLQFACIRQHKLFKGHLHGRPLSFFELLLQVVIMRPHPIGGMSDNDQQFHPGYRTQNGLAGGGKVEQIFGSGIQRDGVGAIVL